MQGTSSNLSTIYNNIGFLEELEGNYLVALENFKKACDLENLSNFDNKNKEVFHKNL